MKLCPYCGGELPCPSFYGQVYAGLDYSGRVITATMEEGVIVGERERECQDDTRSMDVARDMGVGGVSA